MKANGVMILMIVLMSCSFVVAQSENNVSVIAGNVTELDLGHVDEGSSSTLGGLVASVNTEFRRWVKMGAVKLWETETIVPSEPNFELYVVPSGSSPDFNNITVGSLFEQSENVTINSVTGIWNTNSVDVGGVSGYTTSAQNGQTVLIAPSSSYDVYAILP